MSAALKTVRRLERRAEVIHHRVNADWNEARYQEMVCDCGRTLGRQRCEHCFTFPSLAVELQLTPMSAALRTLEARRL